MLLEQIAHLTDRINALKERIAAMSNEARCLGGCRPCRASDRSPRSRSKPSRRRWSSSDAGRDFAAWLGLVPRQDSTGGKQQLGKTSKMGQRDIRRLLVIGAMAVIRWALAPWRPEGSWLARMLERKPPLVVASRWRTRWRAASGRC